MFRPSKCPAQQLQSVALRHRHALAVRGAGRRGGQPWHPLESSPAPKATKASGPYRRDEKLTRVEALLFVAREPLTSRRIAQLASLADGTEARTLIRRLNHFYDAQASSFRVEQVAGGYQILTRPKFGGWLRRLHPSSVETRLSAPALETLAVVAYRQPVVRAEVESIRGVQCGEILRQLIERDLVRITGRSEELGRPFLYSTTRRFLLWIGLRSLDDLPRAATLRRMTPDTGESLSDESCNELTPAARRDDELNPRNDLNEESEVKYVATPESDHSEANQHEPWKLAAAASLLAPLVAAEDEEEEIEDDEELDDEDDDYEDEDEDDEDFEDDDLEDDDLEDEEWEEVDDEDDWEDEDDEDWEEDDDEEEDEEWEDE
jgi:segregation and condensation protein B